MEIHNIQKEEFSRVGFPTSTAMPPLVRILATKDPCGVFRPELGHTLTRVALQQSENIENLQLNRRLLVMLSGLSTELTIWGVIIATALWAR
jgi:hypothetical protein